MGTSQHVQLPPDLLGGQRWFREWRAHRKLGRRIPQSLWAMAIQLAESHGVSRRSMALGLDYYSLKKRAEGAAAPPQSSGPAFLELTPPVLVAKQCRLEFDNGSGTTMRVQLVGYGVADLEALSRSFWEAG